MSLLEANNKRMIRRMEEEQQRKIAQAVEARKQFPYQLIRTQEIEEDYFEGGNESSGTLVALDELCHCHECIFCFCGISLSSGASFLSIAQSCPNTDYDGSGGNIWLLSLKGLLQGSTKESFRMRHYSSKKCLTKN